MGLSQQCAKKQREPNHRPADSSGAPEAFGAGLLVGAPPRARRVTPPSWRPPQPHCVRPTGAQSFLLCSTSTSSTAKLYDVSTVKPLIHLPLRLEYPEDPIPLSPRFTIHTIRGVGYRMELDAMTKP